MPKEGHVSFEDLQVKFGFSATPSALYMYSPEENEFRERVREFIHRKISPLADEAEETGKAEPLLKAIRVMGSEGINRAYFPKEVGGEGRGVVHRTIRGEELTAISYAVSMAAGTSVDLFGMPVAHHGTPEQRKRFLTPVMKGEKVGAIAITEPGAGSDAVGGMRMRARKEGKEYVLSGEKKFITNGAIADFMIVYAVTDPQAPHGQGITAFVVETEGLKGFKVLRNFGLLGRRGVVNSWLAFEDCRIPAGNLLGKENRGVEVLLGGLDGERISGTAGYVGCARSAYEIALKYAAERMQFGKPLRAFEGVSFKLAEMYSRLEAMRLLMLRAARMVDAGLPATKEAAAAKFFAADNGWWIVDEALQILGGIGYTDEYPLERYLRDFRVGRIAAGSSEILRFLVQRELYKEIGYI